MPAPWLLGLALVIGLLVLIPARRLSAGGVSQRVVAAYTAGLWLAGMLLALRPLGGRVLVPVVLVAYLAPFIATPDVVGRVIRRARPGRALKDVTPRRRPAGRDRPTPAPESATAGASDTDATKPA